MKITALVENHTNCELKAKHGLSFYIQTKNHEMLFDLGPDDTLFENAKMRGIDLSDIDTVIISHGHMDHGGALKKFLQINSKAQIYIQRKAFEPHFSKLFFIKIGIGIDSKLAAHQQIRLLDGDFRIDDELLLFTAQSTDEYSSPANSGLYSKNGKDDFSHEQNLIINENQTALIMGCGHVGVVNILERAKEYQPQICVGGYHLFNRITKKSAPNELLDAIAKELQGYSQTKFYTCHCTGLEVFQYLSKKTQNIFYFSCGETIEL